MHTLEINPARIRQQWARLFQNRGKEDEEEAARFRSWGRDDDMPDPGRFFETKQHKLHELPLCRRCATLPFGERREGEPLDLFEIDQRLFDTWRTCGFCALVTQSFQSRDSQFRPDQMEWGYEHPLRLVLNSTHDRLHVHHMRSGGGGSVEELVSLNVLFSASRRIARSKNPILGIPSIGGRYSGGGGGHHRGQSFSKALQQAPTTLGQLEMVPQLKSAITPCCRVRSRFQNGGPLPDRVLELVDTAQWWSESASVRLIDTRGRTGRYAALSHCWGGLVPTRTTIRNLEQLRAGISLDHLPSSFRDAVLVTQAMGLRFLWIDALCIIQDDLKDWEEQAPKMRQVYGCSACTIAVHSAANSNEGFLHAFHVPPTLTVKTRSKGSDRDCYMSVKIPDLNDEAITRAYSRSRILSRGWIFQELILSERILHVVENRFLWECTCPKVRVTTKTQQLVTTFGQTFRKEDSWLVLMEEYTKLSLTKALPDRLVAIQGIAQAYMTRDASSGRRGRRSQQYRGYASGVFLGNLHNSLLWNEESKRYRTSDRKVSWCRGRAATWTWASREGHLRFFVNHVSSDMRMDPCAQILTLGGCDYSKLEGELARAKDWRIHHSDAVTRTQNGLSQGLQEWSLSRSSPSFRESTSHGTVEPPPASFAAAMSPDKKLALGLLVMNTLVYKNVSTGCVDKSKYFMFANATGYRFIDVLYRPSEKGPPYEVGAYFPEKKLTCGWAVPDQSIPEEAGGKVWDFVAISTLTEKSTGTLSRIMGLIVAPAGKEEEQEEQEEEGAYIRVGLACMYARAEGFERRRVVIV